jgi:hypothetical protein
MQPRLIENPQTTDAVARVINSLFDDTAAHAGTDVFRYTERRDVVNYVKNLQEQDSDE